jgi:hypothetical protein
MTAENHCFSYSGGLEPVKKYNLLLLSTTLQNHFGALMQAKICDGSAEIRDFVRVNRPPDEAPLMDIVSTPLSME